MLRIELLHHHLRRLEPDVAGVLRLAAGDRLEVVKVGPPPEYGLQLLVAKEEDVGGAFQKAAAVETLAQFQSQPAGQGHPADVFALYAFADQATPPGIVEHEVKQHLLQEIPARSGREAAGTS